MFPDVTAERRDVQRLLRLGLAGAAALMTAGLVVALWSGAPDVALQPRTLLQRDLPLSVRLCGLGVLLLAATPALRVLTLIVLWIRERDWKYAAVAVSVAIVLGAAVVLGGR